MKKSSLPYHGIGHAHLARESGRTSVKEDQPDWEEVGHMGDVNWPEYGGGPVFVDRTGNYEPELVYVQPPPDDLDFGDPQARWEVYRVVLDPEVPSWGDVEEVANSAGDDPSALREAFTSDDPLRRAWAYESFAAHYGWAHFDEYPRLLTCFEMNEQYDADLDCFAGIDIDYEQYGPEEDEPTSGLRVKAYGDDEVEITEWTDIEYATGEDQPEGEKVLRRDVTVDLGTLLDPTAKHRGTYSGDDPGMTVEKLMSLSPEERQEAVVAAAISYLGYHGGTEEYVDAVGD